MNQIQSSEINNANKFIEFKFRHRQEMCANRFEQFEYISEDEENSDVQNENINTLNKRLINKPKKNQKDKVNKEEDESDSSSSDDDTSSISSDDCSDASSCISDSDSEEHDVWDNREFEMYGIDIDNLKYCKNQDQSFFTLYKLRYQQMRNFFSKKLTQKQHQDININILKIIKCLSNNKVQYIQCHNYNYCQPLQENQSFQNFHTYFQNYNSSRKNIQNKQKSEFIQNNIQKKKSISVQKFIPQPSIGLKNVMNRASFSSQCNRSEYFMTGERIKSNQTLLSASKKLNIDQSLANQDIASSIARRTIKDFDIDCDKQQEDKKQIHDSPLEIVSQQKSPYASNQKSDSLSHITDNFESLQYKKQTPPISSILQQTPQRKFKISSISTCKIVSKKSNISTPSPSITFNSKESISSCLPFQNSNSKQSTACDNSCGSRQSINKIISMEQLKIAGLNHSSINEINDDVEVKDGSASNLNNNDVLKTQIDYKQKSSSQHQLDQSPISFQNFKFNNKKSSQNRSSLFTQQQQISFMNYASQHSQNVNSENSTKKSPTNNLSQNQALLQYTTIRPVSQSKISDRFLPNIKQDNKSQKLTEMLSNNYQNNNNNCRSTSYQVRLSNNLLDNIDGYTPSTTNSTSPTAKQNTLSQKPESNQNTCFSQKLNSLENQSNNQESEKQNTQQSSTPINFRIPAYSMSNDRNQISLRHQKVIVQSTQPYNTLIQKKLVNQLTPEQRPISSDKQNIQSNQTKNSLVSTKTVSSNDCIPTTITKFNHQNTFFKNQYISTNSQTQNYQLVMNFKQLAQS